MSREIVFVVADITAIGGIERVITHLASFLSEKNKVEIISVHRSCNRIAYPVSSKVEITYIDGAVKPLGNPGSLYKFIKHFVSAIKLNITLLKRKNNIIVINSFPIAVISYFATFFAKSTIVVEHVYYGYYSKVLQQLRKKIYKRFNRVIALTNRDTEMYLNDGLRSLTIPNPLSAYPEKIHDPFRENKKIVAVGRLVFQKGFDILIKSFAKIPLHIRDGWVLEIYGEGSERFSLQKIINSMSLQESVVLAGNSSHLMNIYPNYDFFVLSSRFEGFGMVLLEAMSCGLPCISFDCPTGPREILNNGQYGLLCENGNEAMLTEKMIFLMTNQEQRVKLSELSLIRCQDYEISHISNKWHELFIQLDEE